MSRPLARSRLVGLLAAAVVLVGVTSCSKPNPLGGAVLRVGDWKLTKEQAVAELDAVARAKVYVERRQAQTPGWRPYGDGPGGFDRGLVREVFTAHIDEQVHATELARRGLSVTDEDRAAARVAAAGRLGLAAPTPAGGGVETEGTAPGIDESAFSAVGPYAEVLVSGVAAERALRRAFAEGVDQQQAMRERFEADGRALATRICASQIVLAARSEGDQAMQDALTRATPALADLDRGRPFDEVARERSETPTVQLDGGDLGCGPVSRFESGLQEVVQNQPIGQISPPLQIGRSYRIVLVRSRDTLTFEQMEPTLRQLVAGEGDRRYQAWRTEARKTLSILVDPSWGVWSPQSGGFVDASSVDQMKKAVGTKRPNATAPGSSTPAEPGGATGTLP